MNNKEHEEARETLPAPFWTVAIYLVDKSYGGPEEGGWWYTLGERQDQPLEGLSNTLLAFICPSEQAAMRFAKIVQDKLDAGINVGRRDISSVLSTGRYYAEVHNGYPPAFYPETRPHYE